MTKEEIISSVKLEFKGEFCYTAQKIAMERYAVQQAIAFLKWFCESGIKEGNSEQLWAWFLEDKK